MRAIFGLIIVVLVGCGRVEALHDASVGGDGAAPDAAPGCVANSVSCGDDDALYECDAEGAALTKVQDCQYGCAGDRCKACAADTTFCNGSDLVACSSNGELGTPQTCAFGCQADRCNTCEPNARFCDNANAVTCGANGEPEASMACGAPGCSGGVCNTCVPNTTSCQGDTLVVCNAGGTVASTTACALGCGTTPAAHCRVLVPSYGVPAPSGTLSPLVVDDNATLNITSCPNSVSLTIGANTEVLVGSPTVASASQTGGPPICIVRFASIMIAEDKTLTITNDATSGHVLSLQALGDVQIDGTITFINAANGVSPGATVNAAGTNASGKVRAPGAGGAGAAFAGGIGGSCVGCSGSFNVGGGAGGAAVSTILSRLTAGSVGGHVMNGTTTVGTGGRGGGGLQLVSLTRITVTATGRIALNGRGGGGTSVVFDLGRTLPAGGAGSGGSLVIEAPVVNFATGAIAAANGGGGSGGCSSCTMSGRFIFCSHHSGQPGQLSAARAAGGNCPTGGDGGFEANGATAPPINGENSDSGAATYAGGGGGGSSGFVILRGRSAAQVMINGGAIVSPAPTVGAVTAN